MAAHSATTDPVRATTDPVRTAQGDAPAQGSDPTQDGAAATLPDSEVELLRFTTAGSVDDGKSTLIGRLLHDTRSVFDDQFEQLQGVGRGRVAGGARGANGARGADGGRGPGSARETGNGQVSDEIDLALLTDGLRDERAQGITIDVAYRYFATPKRRFIIADTPGHLQYTRNMVTGASTADLAVILIDASKGLLTQSRRHAFISSLLGIE
jgi:sulfate adenylyltransferase subunit 1 (EFTu-like GTPase family)